MSASWGRNSRTGLFGPDSRFWQLNREWLILPAGLRAILLQMAHPAIAAGVARHSDFRADPFGRLEHTLSAFWDLSFGDLETAQAAARRIHRAHRPVHGRYRDARTGETRAYDANDPSLKLWVAATLVDSIPRAYESLVRPLPVADRQAYYKESMRMAPLMGIPESEVPTYSEFARYYTRLLEGEELHVDQDARDIANALLNPLHLGPIVKRAAFVSVGLLPLQFRAEYGLRWGPKQDRRLRLLAFLSRRARAHVPDLLAVTPAALIGELRHLIA